MKKAWISLFLLLALANISNAQHYCIIDSKYILEKMPDYKDAQTKLDNYSKGWQAEIDNKKSTHTRYVKD